MNKTEGTGVQTINVQEADDGLRIEKWFLKFFPGLPKGMVFKLMRKGQIRLDGKRVKPGDKVSTAQEVRVPPMPADAYSAPSDKGGSYSPVQKEKDLKLIKSITIFEDKDVLVLNKPYGIATQGGSKVKHHIDGALRAIASDRCTPHLVHRLDKETTGVLVVAKNRKTAQKLGSLFKGRDVQKYYWAVISPAPEIEEGEIEAKIAKGKTFKGERMIVDEEDGKFSRTEFWVLDKAYTKAAWVCFKPETGRTHQLRVHSQLMGSPIIGDEKYSDTDRHMEMPVILDDLKNADKLHLHARRLVMPHPAGHGKLDVTAPLPKHMSDTFKYFGFDESREKDIDLI